MNATWVPITAALTPTASTWPTALNASASPASMATVLDATQSLSTNVPMAATNVIDTLAALISLTDTTANVTMATRATDMTALLLALMSARRVNTIAPLTPTVSTKAGAFVANAKKATSEAALLAKPSTPALTSPAHHKPLARADSVAACPATLATVKALTAATTSTNVPEDRIDVMTTHPASTIAAPTSASAMTDTLATDFLVIMKSPTHLKYTNQPQPPRQQQLPQRQLSMQQLLLLSIRQLLQKQQQPPPLI
jgi:hypothetical protein